MKKSLLLSMALTALIPVPAFAVDPIFSLDFMTGTAFNFPTPLTVRQAGQPDIRLTADYDTKPFGPATPYYAWRVSLWDRSGAWEAGQVHHRLFLTNRPPEIGHFAVHYGYNLFYLGRAWRWSGYIFHLGAGPLITSPENSVRGLHFSTPGDVFDGGYYLSGIGFTGSVSRNFYLTRNVFLVGEAALMAGFAWWIPVANGSADVPTLGLHGRFGAGFSL